MWYSPVILPKLEETINQSYSQENQQTLRGDACSGENIKGSVMVPSIRKRTREKSIRAYFKSEKNRILYSGECDFPFRIRICGVENLFRIFEQVNRYTVFFVVNVCWFLFSFLTISILNYSFIF